MEAFEKSFVSRAATRSAELHKRLRQRQAPAVTWGNWDITMESEVCMRRVENVRYPITIWSTSLLSGLKVSVRRVSMSPLSARGACGDREGRLTLIRRKIELDLVQSRVLKSGKNIKSWAHQFTTDAHMVASTMLSHPFFAVEMQEDTKDFEVACCSYAETPTRSLVVAIVAWTGSEHVPFNMDLARLRRPVLAEPRCFMMRRLLEELCLTALDRKGPMFRCKNTCHECDKMGKLLKSLHDDWVRDLPKRNTVDPAPNHPDKSWDYEDTATYADARKSRATGREDPLCAPDVTGGAQCVDDVISRHSSRASSATVDLSPRCDARPHDAVDAPVMSEGEGPTEVKKQGHSEDEVILFADQLSEGMEVVAVTEKGTHCPVMIKSDSHNFYLSILRTDKTGRSSGIVGQTKTMKLSMILGADDDERLVTISLDENQKFKLLMPTKTNAHFLARLLTAFGQGSSVHSEATPAPSRDDYAASHAEPEPVHESHPHATTDRAPSMRSHRSHHGSESHDADRPLYPQTSRVDSASCYAVPRPHTARSYFDVSRFEHEGSVDDLSSIHTPRQDAVRDMTRRADAYLQRARDTVTNSLARAPSGVLYGPQTQAPHLLPSSPPPSAGGNRGVLADGTPNLAPSLWSAVDNGINAAGRARACHVGQSHEDLGAVDVKVHGRDVDRRAVHSVGPHTTAFGSTSASTVRPATADAKDPYGARVSGLDLKGVLATPLRTRGDAASAQQHLDASLDRLSGQVRHVDGSSRRSSKSVEGAPLVTQGERPLGVEAISGLHAASRFRGTSSGSEYVSPWGSPRAKTARSARDVIAEDAPSSFQYRNPGSISARYAVNPADKGGRYSEAPTRDSTASGAYARPVANAQGARHGLPPMPPRVSGTEPFKKMVHPIPR